VILLYYLTPLKWRWVTLLASSFFFYINIKPVYVLLLISAISSTYLFTRLIVSTVNESRRTLYLVSNIIIVLLPLFFFKYFPVINNALIQLLENWDILWPLPEIKYLLPVGISFYTFMAIGYTVDVYNEELDAEKNIGMVALFLSFFPLILSGPIERAKNMLPQFRQDHPINYQNISAGLKLMLWGYFMKLVVADRIGIYIDVIYIDISGFNGSSLLIASLLYPFQVYADLGGYSLIAIGTAGVLGFKVMQNFNRPFFATSMADFWRRWHMSLITWLTDYIYTPLSFNFRKYKMRGIVTALMLTFFISGIWHSASMTFIVWGLMQGIFLSFEAVTNKYKTAAEKRYNLNGKVIYIAGSMVVVFIFFTSSLIFGRAANIYDALEVFNKIFTENGSPYLDLTTLSYSFAGIFILLFKDFKDEYYQGRLSFLSSRKIWVRYCSYLSIIFLILLFGVFKGNSFIYFQF
jgi:D-alanyl-lipoteichoic acid acyltransferase DltB (MBOAT superfamily)